MSLCDAANAIRRVKTNIKPLGPHESVFKNECQFTFDTPESPGGLYLNVVTRRSVCEEYLPIERLSSSGVFYIHQVWNKIPIPQSAKAADENAPIKLAIGLPGGFDSPKFEIVKTYRLVVFLGNNEDNVNTCVIDYPLEQGDDRIPLFAYNIAQSIIDYEEKASSISSTWVDDTKPMPSKYYESLVQEPTLGKTISPNPVSFLQLRILCIHFFVHFFVFCRRIGCVALRVAVFEAIYG